MQIKMSLSLVHVGQMVINRKSTKRTGNSPLKQLGKSLILIFSWKCGSHVDCLSQKYTIYVHCHHEDVYSNFRRVNVVFMLLFIHLLALESYTISIPDDAPSRIKGKQQMSLWTDISYSSLPGAHEFIPLVLCRVHVVQSLVFCAVF